LLPPLSYQNDHFDLIFANSVFTHLTEEAQDRWLPELARILKPDGLVIASFHGETQAAFSRQSLDRIAKWMARGIDDEATDPALAGFIADDQYYRATFHTRDYIKGRWSRWVDIRGIHPHVFRSQDAVVFGKRTHSET
jgi:SAM-dependent methyltransferase